MSQKVYLIYSNNLNDDLKIVPSWDECKSLTSGIKGKQFKSYKSDQVEEIALWFLEIFLKENDSVRTKRENELKDLLKITDKDIFNYYNLIKEGGAGKSNEEVQSLIDKVGENNFIAYTDGSYDVKTKEYSAGFCIVYNDKIIFEYSNKYLDKNNMRQINGELKAALFACNYAIKKNISKLYIAFDYSGVELFANKSWNSKNTDIKFYVSTMEQNMKKVDIEFIKIPAHNNFKYNEYVDKLCKKALNLI